METTHRRFLRHKILVFALLLQPLALTAGEVVNDVTQLNPIVVNEVIRQPPRSLNEARVVIVGCPSNGNHESCQGGAD
jgi:hypothetical protein